MPQITQDLRPDIRNAVKHPMAIRWRALARITAARGNGIDHAELARALNISSRQLHSAIHELLKEPLIVKTAGGHYRSAHTPSR